MALFKRDYLNRRTPPNLGYRTTEPLARGQLCDIDFKTKTVRPCGDTRKAERLERELQSLGWNGDRS